MNRARKRAARLNLRDFFAFTSKDQTVSRAACLRARFMWQTQLLTSNS